MAWPKVFSQILEKLDSIEQKIDKINSTKVMTSVEKKSTVSPPESEILGDISISDYDKYTAADILRRAKDMSSEDKRSLLDYERDHKNRSLVIEALSK